MRWSEIPRHLCPLAVDAVKIIELDFGAVDIMGYPEDSRLPRFSICEINTAPRLEGYTAERYAQYFDWLIDGKMEREHFKDTKKYIFRPTEM